MPTVEHDVKLGHPKRRRHLIFYNARPHPIPDNLRALLQGLRTSQVDAYRAVELERAATGV